MDRLISITYGESSEFSSGYCRAGLCRQPLSSNAVYYRERNGPLQVLYICNAHILIPDSDPPLELRNKSMRCATSLLLVDCPLSTPPQLWTPDLWAYNTYGPHTYSQRLPEPLPNKTRVSPRFQGLGIVGHRVYPRMSSH